VNWAYFLPWMGLWAGTMTFCLGVGFWCGYWTGRDRATDDETEAREAARRDGAGP
jgi:hypothetical protein